MRYFESPFFMPITTLTSQTHRVLNPDQTENPYSHARVKFLRGKNEIISGLELSQKSNFMEKLTETYSGYFL